jgi:hypothetical protein
MKIVQSVSRKGHVLYREEGPFLVAAQSTSAPETFGSRLCDEVWGCVLSLPFREREIVEFVVMGVILNAPVALMRHAMKVLRLGKTRAYSVRRTAFERLAKMCREKGLG